MPRSAFSRMPSARREEILDRAALAFAAQGYEATSYNELIASLGLSKGSAYHLFESKADLYGAVLQRELGALLSEVVTPQPARNRPDFWRGVRAWLQQTIRFTLERPALTALLQDFASAQRAGALASTGEALMGLATGPLLVLLEDGQRVGAVRGDLPLELSASLATAALSTLDVYFLERLRSMASPDVLEDTLDLYEDTLKRLLA